VAWLRSASGVAEFFKEERNDLDGERKKATVAFGIPQDRAPILI
jgi:hypothetical protein